jgi:ribonuclease Z
MSIQVTILGCGSATPTLFRNPTAQWIELHGRFFLIDCGEGTQVEMLRHKLKMSKLKAIFISHLHGDHFFGLPGLISSMHLMGRKEKLQIIGPQGLKEIIELIFHHSETSLRFALDIMELEPGYAGKILAGNSFEVFAFPLNHRISCFGFKFSESPKMRNLKPEMIEYYKVPVEDRKKIKEGADFIDPDGKRIPNSTLCYSPSASVQYAFCSDTAPGKDIIEYVKGVDALYHEATFENDLETRAADTFHSTAAQAAGQAREAKVKKLYLGHFSSRYRDTDIILNQAIAVFSNTVTVSDGYSFSVE